MKILWCALLDTSVFFCTWQVELLYQYLCSLSLAQLADVEKIQDHLGLGFRIHALLPQLQPRLHKALAMVIGEHRWCICTVAPVFIFLPQYLSSPFMKGRDILIQPGLNVFSGTAILSLSKFSECGCSHQNDPPKWHFTFTQTVAGSVGLVKLWKWGNEVTSFSDTVCKMKKA